MLHPKNGASGRRAVLGESALSIVPTETGQAPSLLSVAAEETFLFPLGTVVVVGYVDQQAADDFFIFCGGCEIDGLVQVVGRCVVAVGQPIFEDLLLGRARLGADAHDDRWDSVADEVVLVAAD